MRVVQPIPMCAAKHPTDAKTAPTQTKMSQTTQLRAAALLLRPLAAAQSDDDDDDDDEPSPLASAQLPASARLQPGETLPSPDCVTVDVPSPSCCASSCTATFDDPACLRSALAPISQEASDDDDDAWC